MGYKATMNAESTNLIAFGLRNGDTEERLCVED